MLIYVCCGTCTGLCGGAAKCFVGVLVGGVCALCHLVGFSIFFSSDVTSCLKSMNYTVSAGPAFSVMGL